jgi:hypothetical protein
LQRAEQERAQREAQQYAQFQAMGYEPGNFAHELAIQTARQMEQFVATQQPALQTFEHRQAELDRQRMAHEYIANLTAHLDRSIEGLNVTPEMKEWLFETAKEQAMLYDDTVEGAVQRTFRKAQLAKVLPPRQPPKGVVKKPKARPPKEVLSTSAAKSNRSGRKPGKQTKGPSKRNRSPEDELFPELDSKEW